jgi:hypothetical protein
MAPRVPKAELTGSTGAMIERLTRKIAGEEVGCGWCLFTPLERDVLEYAEAMTNTPPTVTDELSARLFDRLGPAAMIELTEYIARSNLSTRRNTAFGVESPGFSAVCEMPICAFYDGG